MAPNQPNDDTPEPRVVVPVPNTPISVHVRVGPASEPDDRLVEIDTERVGSEDNWVQLGPTSYPSDSKLPYARDVDGDGHTDFGMQLNISPDVGGGIPAVGGAVLGAAAGAGLPGIAAGAAVGYYGPEALKAMDAHLTLGFNVEPGPAIERIQDLGSDIGEGIQDLGSDIGEGIQDLGSDIGEGIQDLGSDIGEGIQDLGTNLRQKGRSVWDRINDRFPVPFGNNETGGILRGGVGQISGMRRLDEAFARLQSLF